jgi:hypothetical protein
MECEETHVAIRLGGLLVPQDSSSSVSERVRNVIGEGLEEV